MIEELQELGLSYYESKALGVLFKKTLSLKQLSKEAEIPFGKIYSVVKNLREKNLVKENNSRPKLVYVENVSDIMARLIKEKQNKNKAIREKLREIATSIDKSKEKKTAFFQIGTSVLDNRKIQMRTFKEAEFEVLQILNIHHKPKSNRESKTLWEKEIVKAVKKGVKFKAIYPKKTVLPKILKKLHKTNPKALQIKRFNTDFVRCDIIDEKKVLLKIVQDDPLQFGGVLFIENESLADNLKKIFEEMWEQAV
jgi:sugar-specific transcriptional regulator TrmB